MNKDIIAINKRTGTEYVKVEEGSAGLLRVFTKKTKSGINVLPENIEMLETMKRVVKPRKVKGRLITFDEPMYEMGMQIQNKETGEVLYRYQAEAPVEFILQLMNDALQKGKKHIEVYQLTESLENKEQ